MIRHNPRARRSENMDRLPFVTPDLHARISKIEKYFIGYLTHPYVSLYTGRGCRSRCTFCLWPQTVGGHRYRTRCAANVESTRCAGRKELFPQVKEFFFDDDTFTDDEPRAADDRAASSAGSASPGPATPRPMFPRDLLKSHERQRSAAAARRVTRAAISRSVTTSSKGVRLDVARRFTQRLPRARHRHPRHVHSRLAGRDAGDDRGDDPFCL